MSRQVRAVAVVLGVALVLGVVALGTRWRQHRSQDRALCALLQRLVEEQHRSLTLERLHASGGRADTRLGRIVRSAEGTDGSLDVVSEDYDYALTRCRSLGRPAPNVDPAHRGAG